ncbi:MAG TPA: sugar phosphate isomerase/epimerase [Candidatus Blautia intestinipullorum]|nr:sugar phosphate isomerase/epimerase [Candidatus Blautia intestinipullorum]
MKSGFCVSLKELNMLTRYLENCDKKPLDFVDLSGTEICELTEKDTEALAECLYKYQIPCMGIYASFPADIKFIGKEKKIASLEDYTRRLAERCDILDCKRIGIGSPGSRFRDADISEEEADEQMMDTLYRIRQLTQNQMILLESICPAETNYINSAGHVEALVNRLDDPGIGIICDIYHFFCCNEQIEGLDSAFWSKVVYLHIADPDGRRYLSKSTDSSFIEYAGQILKKAYRADGIAVEAGTEQITEELEECKATLRLLESEMNL